MGNIISVTGKHGIKATILADSISEAGVRFTTYELEYPRIILAEANTHRMLSKNSFSSRAVPFLKMLDNLTGRPVEFGGNQSGMQSNGEHTATVNVGHAMGLKHDFHIAPEGAWNAAKHSAIEFARAFADAGYHKQVFNRLLEPWQMMKTVLSGTEFNNVWWLRDHDAADPSFHELARVMHEARELSTSDVLAPGEWHLPYVDFYRKAGVQTFYLRSGNWTTDITLEEAIKVSCARCAAVSYRNEDYGLDKSTEVYGRLVGADRKHASAFEHQGTPMNVPPAMDTDDGLLVGGRGINKPYWPETWQKGVTHVDRKGQLWSGNLRGFIQYRKLIPGENCEG